MAEMNTIYILEGNVVGIFRFGVAWKKEPRIRLGEYDDDFVYANDGSMIAKVGESGVVDIIGDTIGEFKGNELCGFPERRLVNASVAEARRRLQSCFFLVSMQKTHNKCVVRDSALNAPRPLSNR